MREGRAHLRIDYNILDAHAFVYLYTRTRVAIRVGCLSIFFPMEATTGKQNVCVG